MIPLKEFTSQLSKTKDLNCLNFSLVRPLVEYATLLLHGTHTQIEISRRRAARLVCNRYNTSSVSDMIKHLQWPSIQQRR